MPRTLSWVQSRLALVVLPEEEGPAIRIARAPRFTISWAISANRFSCRASLTRMSSRTEPFMTMSLRSATEAQRMSRAQRSLSAKTAANRGDFT